VSVEPRGRPITTIEQARTDAQRQARSFSSVIVLMVGIALAVLVVGAYVFLDYHLQQDPHRLVKLTVGGSLLASILLVPHVGLFTVPLLTPFILWLPKMPIPGVNTLNILMVSVFFSFTLPRVLQHQPVFRNGAVGWCLLGILGLAGISIFRGEAYPTGYEYDAGKAGIELFRTAMCFSVFFIALAMIRGDRQRRLMTWAVVLGLMAEALMTIKMGRNFRGRASGSISQPNDLGAFLAMFTAFAAAAFFGFRRWWARGIVALAVLSGCAAEVLTVSRGGILALGLALGYVALRSSRVLSVLLLVAVISSPAWAPDFLKERVVGTRVQSEDSDEAELENSSAERVATWKAIGDLLADHPIEGVGFTGLNNVLAMISTTQALDIKDSAHNSYLRFLGEMGIGGLALFLWTLWTCWSLGATGMRVAGDHFSRQLALGLCGATLAMAVSCMFGDRFFPVTLGGNFWVAAALVTDVVDEAKKRPA